MTNRWLPAVLAGTMAGLMASTALAQTSADFGFIVDESGSMSGEQDFIPQLVSTLDGSLNTRGITNNRYGMVGYGASDPRPRLVTQMGSAADVARDSAGLQVSGGFEDGYEAIDFSQGTFNFRGGVGRQYLIITDEDRDIASDPPNAASILNDLRSSNTGLNGIVNINLVNPTNPTDQVVVVDQLNRIYVVDPSTPQGYRRIQLTNAENPIVPGFDTTVADYVDLGFQTVGGCFGSIDQFRTNDPVVVNAFANALVDCLTVVIAETPGSISTQTQLVMRNFFGTAAYATSYLLNPQFLALNQTNPYLRRQGNRGAVLGFNLHDIGNGTASGATADVLSDDKKWGAFITGRYDFGDRDNTATMVGSDFDSYSITGGLDYAVTPEMIVGAAFSYSNLDNDLNNGTDGQKFDSYTGYIYGTYVMDAFYTDVIGFYGHVEQDTTRLLGATTINGKTDGEAYGFGARFGYDFHPTEAWTAGPTIALRWARTRLDAYTETGGPGALAVNDQNFTSAVMSLGGNASLYLSDLEPATVVLSGRAAWEHDFNAQGGGASVFVAPAGGGPGRRRH